MALVVPNGGETVLLDRLLKLTNVTDNYLLHLYKNNYTPLSTSVKSDFTEANFTNYAATTLTRSTWASSTLNGSNKAQSTYAAQSWTCGVTTNTVYGYYMTDSTDTTLLWAEQFGIARTLAENDILSVTPVFTLSSE